MRRGWMVLGSMVLASVAAGHWGCEVPPLMAPGSSIQLIANPEFIVANGGVSVITAIVTEPAGTFAPDGSVVLFFTNLGRVDPQGKTVNGVARVNLVADSRSGPARVTGIAAGGDAPAPAPSGSPSTSPTTGGSGQSTVTVTIGSALPSSVVLTAGQLSIRTGGSTSLTANVFDERGNPVANVPVIFAVSAQTGGLDSRLDSGGAQRFTDTNGQAFDTLRTRAGTSGTATIGAAVPGGAATRQTVTITVTL